MKGRTDASERPGTIALAERAAATLTGSLADKPDEAPIETNAASLRGLAAVIGKLLEEVRACAGADCMGRSIEGVRLWATQDRLDQETRRAADATARAERYAAALHAIASTQAASAADFAMLVDWQNVAVDMSAKARAALAPPARA